MAHGLALGLAAGWATVVTRVVGGPFCSRQRPVEIEPTSGFWVRKSTSTVQNRTENAWVRVLGQLAARRAQRERDRGLRRELPVAIDLLTVGLQAGCSIYEAIVATQAWAPPLIAEELAAVGRRFEHGEALPHALDEMARSRPVLARFARAVADAARSGAPLAPLLATLGADERAAVRRRAEAHARRVPVRLLFPLVFLVLPAFGLLTVVPVLVAGFTRT